MPFEGAPLADGLFFSRAIVLAEWFVVVVGLAEVL